MDKVFPSTLPRKMCVVSAFNIKPNNHVQEEKIVEEDIILKKSDTLYNVNNLTRSDAQFNGYKTPPGIPELNFEKPLESPQLDFNIFSPGFNQFNGYKTPSDVSELDSKKFALNNQSMNEFLKSKQKNYTFRNFRKN